jgi:hypothetical protein
VPVRRAFAGGLAAAVIAAAPAYAARPVAPPLTELTRNYNFVLVAEAESRDEGNRIAFRRVENLSTESGPVVNVRMNDKAYANVKLGTTYIVAYTTVTSNPQFREAKYLDPEGPRLLDVRGLGTPALFEPTPQLRFLFQSARAEKPPPDRAVLDALLAQMARPDHASRTLVILEFYLRPALHALINEADAKTVRQTIADTGLDTELRSFLLEAALHFPASAKATWLADAYRDVIASSGAQYDLASHVPGLVRTAVRGLRVVGDATDVQRLAPLLLSNAPAVATAALETMDALDPGGTPEIVRNALEESVWDDSVNPEVRRALQSYDFEHTVPPEQMN